MDEQSKVEYTFLEVSVYGAEVVRQDGNTVPVDATMDTFAALGWRFVAMVRGDSESQNPIFLMQREAAK